MSNGAVSFIMNGMQLNYTTACRTRKRRPCVLLVANWLFARWGRIEAAHKRMCPSRLVSVRTQRTRSQLTYSMKKPPLWPLPKPLMLDDISKSVSWLISFSLHRSAGQSVTQFSPREGETWRPRQKKRTKFNGRHGTTFYQPKWGGRKEMTSHSSAAAMFCVSFFFLPLLLAAVPCSIMGWSIPAQKLLTS